MALSPRQRSLIDDLLRKGGSHSVADVYKWLERNRNVVGATSANIRSYLRSRHVYVPRSKPQKWRTSPRDVLPIHYSSPG